MSYIRHLYYNILAINNNFILSILLIANTIVPNYFNDTIIKYKLKGDEYYKFILIMNINDEIQNKYNIDMISIGMKLYDTYKNIKKEENDDILSNISDLSDLSDISDF